MALTVFSFAAWTPAAIALEESDRLWLVGQHAFQDKLYPLANRALKSFVDKHPSDTRAPEALLLLGKTRLALGEADTALAAFKRAQLYKPLPGRPQEAKFWEAEALFRLKRYAHARTAYDAVLKENARSTFAPDAVYGLAWTALELKQPDAAVNGFRDLLARWPDHPLAPRATFYLARTLVDQKRNEEALPVLDALLARHASHELAPGAQYLRGVTRIAVGRTPEGVEDLRAFAAARPGDELAGAARRLIVESMLRQGKPGDLEAEYRTIMAAAAPTAESLYDASTIAAKLGNYRDQEAAWRRLRRDFPDDPFTRRAALDLANAAFRRSQFRDALAFAEAATRSQDDAVRAEASLIVGETELKLRQPGNALKAFRAVAATPGVDPALRARALAGSALAHEEQRQWADALKLYEEVATDSPDPALKSWALDAVLGIGKQRLSAGDTAVALEAFRRAQKQEAPARAQEAKFWEGETLFRAKRYAEARVAYDAVITADARAPIAADALYGRAWADLEQKRSEEAIAGFRQLMDGFPDHPRTPAASLQVARLLLDLKRPTDALPVLEAFEARYPAHELAAEATYHRGLARLAMGQTTEGVADLRAFSSANPGHPLAASAKRKMVDAMVASGRGTASTDRASLSETYQTLITEIPATPASLYDAGVIAAQLGKPGDRDVAWHRLRREFPGDRLALRATLTLANDAFRKKEFKETVTLATTAAQTDDTTVKAEALLLLGESELKLKHFAPAVKAFSSAATLPEVDAEVRYRALAGSGLAHEEQRNWKEALPLYEEVSRNSPDETLRKWARDRAAAVREQQKPPEKPATKPAEKPTEKPGVKRPAKPSSR